jgi:hypothetical protein
MHARAPVPAALVKIPSDCPFVSSKADTDSFYLSNSKAVRSITLVDLWASPLDQSSIHFTLATMDWRTLPMCHIHV